MKAGGGLSHQGKRKSAINFFHKVSRNTQENLKKKSKLGTTSKQAQKLCIFRQIVTPTLPSKQPHHRLLETLKISISKWQLKSHKKRAQISWQNVYISGWNKCVFRSVKIKILIPRVNGRGIIFGELLHLEGKIVESRQLSPVCKGVTREDAP